MNSLNHNGIPDKPRRARLYGRVSTEDQAERGTIDGQVTFLRNFCTLYGITIAGEYLDDGISGTIPLPDRPEGRRLLDDVQTDPSSEVIVYRLDRLGRTLKTLLDAHERLEKSTVTIRSATEPFDTSTPIGKFLFQLLASLAELERSTITERMALGRDRVVRQGKWTQARLPFGYDVDANGILVRSETPIPVLNVPEWELARQIYERIADGESLIAVARSLNSLGVPPLRRFVGGKVRQDSEAWSTSRLHRMIHSGTHTGRFVMETKNGPVEATIPPIVSTGTWERAKAQLAKNRTLSRRNAKNFYLLRGLIKCECGANFNGQHPPRARRHYRCNAIQRPNDGRPRIDCHMPSLRADWLEETIWSDIRDYAADPGKPLAEAQRQLRGRLEQTAGMVGERRRLIHQIAEKENERDRVMTLFRRGRIDLDETERQLDAITTETAELRRMLDALRAQENLAQAMEAQLTDAAALLARIHGDIEEIERTNDVERKRQIVELLVKEIRVSTVEGERAPRVDVRYLFGRPSTPLAYAESPTLWRS